MLPSAVLQRFCDITGVNTLFTCNIRYRSCDFYSLAQYSWTQTECVIRSAEKPLSFFIYI